MIYILIFHYTVLVLILEYIEKDAYNIYMYMNHMMIVISQIVTRVASRSRNR